MKSRFAPGWLGACGLAITVMFGCIGLAAGQSVAASGEAKPAPSSATLEAEFFGAIRDGNTKKFLSYVPKGGVNLGPQAKHATRDEIEQQLLAHRGLYCKLFDSSCIEAPINLGASSRPCSDRELLTHSKSVHTAATETTRNEVKQAILVARIENDQCPNDKLVDFIFNLEADGWKLFSAP